MNRPPPVKMFWEEQHDMHNIEFSLSSSIKLKWMKINRYHSNI
ncbi:MAG: hypothetical protein WCF14_00435 [Nitrososphaeraceae archaeon]